MLSVGILVLAGAAALSQTPSDRAKTSNIPDPEDGSVAGGAYVNEYFGLAYSLPAGWSEGLKGPPPSYNGLYVLTALDAAGDGRPSLLIVAQDIFFGVKPFASANDMAQDIREAEARVPNMTIDREPSEIKLAGRDFMRVDYSAGGLYRAWLGTDIRCHVVIFNLTTTDAEALSGAVLSLDKMSFSADATGSGGPVPICLKDYASGPALIHRVDPSPAGPKFLKIPVRIIIGTDGQVIHTHVISAFPEQRKAIEEALRQWRFKPYESMGRPAEVETGLVFEFKPGGQ